MRESKRPNGSAVNSAMPNPMANSARDPPRLARSSPVSIISHSRCSVAEKGAATAGLARRPASSHSAAPPSTLTAYVAHLAVRVSGFSMAYFLRSASASFQTPRSTSCSYLTGSFPGLIPPTSFSVAITRSTLALASPSSSSGQYLIS